MASDQRYKEYNANGFQFSYPKDWTIEEYDDGVSAVSPTEMNWSLRHFPSDMEEEAFLQEVVLALEEEYSSVDVEKTAEQINPGMILHSWEIDFFCMDLPCTAVACTLKTPFSMYFLYYQGELEELDDISEELETMYQSWLEPFKSLDAPL